MKRCPPDDHRLHYLGRSALIWALLMTASRAARPAEYFVGKRGLDSNEGLRREAPFATIQRGMTALKPGDTLTIGPGEYFESIESRFTGDRAKPTVIRAEIPGTVLLRGDRDIVGFTATGDGLTWVMDWPESVEAVNELDTFTIYRRRATSASLEYYSGSWYHDAETAKLYIRTSDSRPPSLHRITVVKKASFGLKLGGGGKATHNVTIDGLAFSGFNSRDRQPWRPGYFTTWGLYINKATDCTVRNCTAFLNGGGIAFGQAERSVIENCTAYGNYAHESPGGGIVIFGPAKDCTIRKCVARDSERAGIRFYAGTLEHCVIEDCTAWNNAYGDFWLKGIHKGDRSRYERCVTPGDIQSAFIKARNCVAGRYADLDKKKNGGYNLLLGKSHPNADFADPGRLDYRPQSGAPFLRQAPDGGDKGLPFQGNVFFLKPDGDDAASGDSIANAWRSLKRAAAAIKAGQTLYLLPGIYPGGVDLKLRGEAGAPIVLRGRSGGPVVFEGGETGLQLEDSEHVVLENLNWVGYTHSGLRLLDVKDVLVTNCGFAGPCGIEALRSDRVKLTHNALRNEVSLRLESVNPSRLAGNILCGRAELDDTSMRGLYSDYNTWSAKQTVRSEANAYDLPAWRKTCGHDLHSLNMEVPITDPARGRFFLEDDSPLAGRGPLGMPIGPYHLRKLPRREAVLTAGVRSVTATTANLQWNCARNDLALKLFWGEDPACRNALEVPGNSAVRTVGLTGLLPDRTYYFRWRANATPRLSITQSPPDRDQKNDTTYAGTFSTLAVEPEPAIYHVAPDGDDGKDGLSRAAAWRTVAHAAANVRAGDRVWIHDGEYVEEIIVRATGAPERPIVFRNAPGASVKFSGERFLATIWSLQHKSDIVLDGLDFSKPGQGAMKGVLDVRHCRDIRIERCFYDGRGGNNPAFLKTVQTDGMALFNNVMISGFFGINISGCRDYLLRNNVFYINSVVILHVMGDEGARFVMENNIFYDMINMKLRNALFYFHEGKHSIVDRYNCYYVRLPGDVRDIYNLSPGPERKRLTLSQFCELTGQPVTSFFANPKAKALSRLRSYTSMEKYLKREGIEGGNEFRYDRQTKTYGSFERSDFFPTHPDCVKAKNGRPIGLDPEAFHDP